MVWRQSVGQKMLSKSSLHKKEEFFALKIYNKYLFLIGFELRVNWFGVSLALKKYSQGHVKRKSSKLPNINYFLKKISATPQIYS